MYFPQSQITPNLYSNGELWYESTLQPYTGYYFKTSKGIYYTGRNPSDRPNVILIDPQTIGNPLTPNPPSQGSPVITTLYENDPGPPPDILENPLYDQSLVYNYFILKNKSLITGNKYIPYYSPVQPTTQDYQNGEFQRYFCKKTNQIQYIEINLDQFSKLKAKDPQIEFSLYEPFTITWILTGNKENVAKVNKNIVELAEKRNLLPKHGEYLKFDYLKYYK